MDKIKEEEIDKLKLDDNYKLLTLAIQELTDQMRRLVSHGR